MHYVQKANNMSPGVSNERQEHYTVLVCTSVMLHNACNNL